MPYPQAEMPADLKRACSEFPDLDNAESVSAAVLIEAPVETVWQAVSSPYARVPANVAYAGRVPGTPEQGVGEMQYALCRQDDTRLTPAVYVTREAARHQRALTQQIGPPHDQMLHRFAPEAGGTRLELTARWPAEFSYAGSRDEFRKRLAESLQRSADNYKALAERA